MKWFQITTTTSGIILSIPFKIFDDHRYFYIGIPPDRRGPHVFTVPSGSPSLFISSCPDKFLSLMFIHFSTKPNPYVWDCNDLGVSGFCDSRNHASDKWRSDCVPHPFMWALVHTIVLSVQCPRSHFRFLGVTGIFAFAIVEIMLKKNDDVTSPFWLCAASLDVGTSSYHCAFCAVFP